MKYLKNSSILINVFCSILIFVSFLGAWVLILKELAAQ
jgi:hypothetical protein